MYMMHGHTYIKPVWSF